MAHKTTELKFNQWRKQISGSLGFACERAPTIDYIYESVKTTLTTNAVLYWLLSSKHFQRAGKPHISNITWRALAYKWLKQSQHTQ